MGFPSFQGTNRDQVQHWVAQSEILFAAWQHFVGPWHQLLRKGSPIHVVLARLVANQLETLRSICAMAEGGHFASTQVLVRKMYETWLVLLSLTADIDPKYRRRDLAKAFIYHSEIRTVEILDWQRREGAPELPSKHELSLARRKARTRMRFFLRMRPGLLKNYNSKPSGRLQAKTIRDWHPFGGTKGLRDKVIAAVQASSIPDSIGMNDPDLWRHLHNLAWHGASDYVHPSWIGVQALDQLDTQDLSLELSARHDPNLFLAAFAIATISVDILAHELVQTDSWTKYVEDATAG